MNENETIPEIAAEMRDAKSVYDRYRCGGADCDVIDTFATVSAYADRIEAAWKREIAEVEASALDAGGIVEASRHTGNAAAMREALESILSILKGFDFENQNAPTPDDLNCVHSAIGIANAALSAPPRNCDVGTAEKQEERYHATGEVYHTLTLTNALEWAQMPYEAKPEFTKKDRIAQ